MSKKYTAEYFIKKFRAIPPRQWTTRFYTDSKGRHCAVGHCQVVYGVSTPESRALSKLFFQQDWRGVTDVNDGLICASLGLKQKTPRGRILAALRHIQNGTVPRKSL